MSRVSATRSRMNDVVHFTTLSQIGGGISYLNTDLKLMQLHMLC